MDTVSVISCLHQYTCSLIPQVIFLLMETVLFRKADGSGKIPMDACARIHTHIEWILVLHICYFSSYSCSHKPYSAQSAEGVTIC